MRKQKSFLLALSLVLLFGSTLPVQANQTLTEDGSVAVPLTAVIESSYSVSIPAALTLTAGAPDSDGTPFTGTVSVGVKGNINPGKAVVVIPSDGQMASGNLTDESINAGNNAVNAVTKDSLNALTDAYETNITVRGAADSSLTGAILAKMQYVRWANESVSDPAMCETRMNASSYTNSSVSLSTKLSTADTYRGNLQFTFRLVDRR